MANITNPTSAYFHSTGAIHIWVRFTGFSTPVYLGTCEQHPTNESEPQWEPVMNDVGGFMTPTDANYQGSAELVIMDLNRFNNQTFDVIESQPSFSQDPGSDGPLDRGSFLLENGKSFEMWHQFLFFGTANAVAYPDMNIGWYYPACRRAGVYAPKQGTKTQMRRLVVEAFNYFAAIAGPNAGFQHKSNAQGFFAPLNGLIPQ